MRDIKIKILKKKKTKKLLHPVRLINLLRIIAKQLNLPKKCVRYALHSDASPKTFFFSSCGNNLGPNVPKFSQFLSFQWLPFNVDVFHLMLFTQMSSMRK